MYARLWDCFATVVGMREFGATTTTTTTTTAQTNSTEKKERETSVCMTRPCLIRTHLPKGMAVRQERAPSDSRLSGHVLPARPVRELEPRQAGGTVLPTAGARRWF